MPKPIALNAIVPNMVASPKKRMTPMLAMCASLDNKLGTSKTRARV